MNFEKSLDFLNSFLNFENEKNFAYPEALSLDRMRRLARDLGNPQNYYPCVIIAGSKGKGSTATILSSILRMENYRVGLYTSPHLWEVSERIRVNGLAVGQTHWTDYMTRIEKVLDDASWRKEKPTYFEVLTAAAFLHFKELKVHVAVLEVGLGGLHDSTNIAQAKAVGITPISLEHTDRLGKTISKIAVQKCGVIKGREWVISAPQVREAEMVIVQAADNNDASLAWVGKDLRISERTHDETSQSFDLKTPFGNFFDLTLPLLGAHQLDNAAMAVGLAKSLEEKARLKVSAEAVRQGIATASWPGRIQKVCEHPLIILDGAHNRDSLRRLMEALPRHFHFGKLTVVLGMMDDKDLEGILEELASETQTLIVTQAGHARSMSTERIAESARLLIGDVRVQPDIESALKEAARQAGTADLILVTGSLYLVAAAHIIIKEKM